MSANPNGINMPRAERSARVRQLKESGLTFDEIARYFGVAKSTVTSAYYDPTGEQNAARKAKYCGTCSTCGATTSYRHGGPADTCLRCSQEKSRSMDNRKRASQRAQKQWTDEEVFAALRSVAVDGKCSGTAYDRKHRTGGEMPTRATLIFRYGSWRKAVEAAGLKTTRNMPERYANRIPDEGLLCAIEDCAAALGRWPSARDYEVWARGGTAVSLAVVRQRFGTWMTALELIVARNEGVPS